MEANDFLDKGLVVSLEAFAVFFQVENGAALRLDLIDVEVVDAGDLIARFCPLHILLFLHISLFGLLFGHSQFVLDAEVVVTALSAPELLKILALELRKFEALLLDGHRRRNQLINRICFQSQI